MRCPRPVGGVADFEFDICEIVAMLGRVMSELVVHRGSDVNVSVPLAARLPVLVKKVLVNVTCLRHAVFFSSLADASRLVKEEDNTTNRNGIRGA